MSDRRDLLRRQFDTSWELARLHVDALTDDDLHWAPTEWVWTVHRGPDGKWRPDFAEIEPEPVPATTIAWLDGLRTRWLAVLDGCDDTALARATSYPWPADAGLTLAHLAAWVDVELVKNASEIGQLRILRAARAANHSGAR